MGLVEQSIENKFPSYQLTMDDTMADAKNIAYIATHSPCAYAVPKDKEQTKQSCAIAIIVHKYYLLCV
jgi:hypothetical protein